MARKSKKISILISNDDGIGSQGIQVLAHELARIGKVTVVAPEREQSTMGHALTLHKPVRLHQYRSERNLDQWSLSGTPADCVYMGIRKVLNKVKPDIIVSGINRGVNVGNDSFYSGTIAAAREGAVLGIPAIATSLDFTYVPGSETPLFEPAARYIADLIPVILKNGMPKRTLLNVNFPNCPWTKIKGVKVTRQGVRFYTDKVTTSKDNRGKPYYWIGGVYQGFKAIEDSDCAVLDQGYISVTPFKIDLTDYDFVEKLRSWEHFSDMNFLKKESQLKKPAKINN